MHNPISPDRLLLVTFFYMKHKTLLGTNNNLCVILNKAIFTGGLPESLFSSPVASGAFAILGILTAKEMPLLIFGLRSQINCKTQ